jgi:hypothetical protein
MTIRKRPQSATTMAYLRHLTGKKTNPTGSATSSKSTSQRTATTIGTANDEDEQSCFAGSTASSVAASALLQGQQIVLYEPPADDDLAPQYEYAEEDDDFHQENLFRNTNSSNHNQAEEKFHDYDFSGVNSYEDEDLLQDDEHDEDSLAELDELIAQSSAKWRLETEEIVRNTLTASQFHNVVSTLNQAYHRQHPKSPSFSHGYAPEPPMVNDTATISSYNNASQTQQTSPSVYYSEATEVSAETIIEQQRAEIVALKAEILRHRSTNENDGKFSCSGILSPVPLRQIEVLVGNGSEDDGHADDLTVWSGFSAPMRPPSKPGVDAASVV